MHMDPAMPYFVGAMAAILLVGVVLRRFRQPHVTAYLLTGALLGPAGLGFIEDVETVARLGEVGVVLLLFFVGMEMSLPKLLEGWRVAVLGTLLQITLSVGGTLILGQWLEWSVPRSVLLGFVISLSSTGVIMKILGERGESNAPVGRDVVGVLLVQDLAIIPMLIAVGLMGGESPAPHTIVTQIVGGIGIVLLLAFLARKKVVRLPFGKILSADHELQIFSAFLLAFGFALLTGLAGLSSALGAFVAGLIVGAGRETKWVTQSLHPFYVLLLALFFVSVGMLLDFRFIWQNAPIIAGLVSAVFLVNTLINAGVLKSVGLKWRSAFYGATLLAQIGEFSFVLAAIGKQTEIISEYGYQMTIATIALTLLLSPFWIQFGRSCYQRQTTPGHSEHENAQRA